MRRQITAEETVCCLGKRRRNQGCSVFCRRYPGSYTIEMAYVMAVFCLMMVVLIQQAYRIHDETKSSMELQEAIELARHREEKSLQEITEEVRRRSGFLLSMEDREIALEETGLGRVSGSVQGSQNASRWSLEISSGQYEPEEFLRQVAALKQLEERNERKLQEGDAP